MFGIGITEILIIGVIILFFARARKLPQIGEDLGKTITNFKKTFRSEEKKDEDVKKFDV